MKQEQWKQELLRTSRFRNESEENEEKFLKLVDEVYDSCTLEVARALMKTFSAEPDYGTQERVVSALSGADPEIMIRAILEELPRLAKEAPEHAEDLVSIALNKNPNLLQEMVLTMDGEIKSALCNLICSQEFIEFYPEAKRISHKVCNDKKY